MSHVFEKVQEVIVDQLGVDTEDVKLESDIAKDFSADSITLMEIVVEIEDAFDIVVPEEELLSITTVGSIVDKIEAELAK